MHKPTINKVVQKFGLFIKFGILTLIFSIQFLSLLSLKVSEQKDTQDKDTHSFFFVRFHVSVLFYQSNIYIYIYIPFHMHCRNKFCDIVYGIICQIQT